MKPYYDRDGIIIYCENSTGFDFRAIGLINVALTDPPYGIEGSSGNINKQRNKGDYVTEFEDNPEYIKRVIVPIIQDLIALCGCVVLTPGNRNFCLYPQPDSFGCFYQPAAAGLQVFDNLDSQPIFYYGKNATKKNMGKPCSYQLTESPPKNGHPCPKPFEAWRKLLSNISLPGQTILDPFMGSGTTLLAAQGLGQKAVGIEISEEYCKIAVDRLRQPSFFSMPSMQPTKIQPEQLGLI